MLTNVEIRPSADKNSCNLTLAGVDKSKVAVVVLGVAWCKDRRGQTVLERLFCSRALGYTEPHACRAAAYACKRSSLASQRCELLFAKDRAQFRESDVARRFSVVAAQKLCSTRLPFESARWSVLFPYTQHSLYPASQTPI